MISEKTKTEAIEFLFDCLRDTMFGDGMEDDYIRDGGSFKGLNNYSDQEILEELLQVTGSDEEIVIRVKTEMEVEKLLTE